MKALPVLLLSAALFPSCIFDEKSLITTKIETVRLQGSDSGNVSLVMWVGAQVHCAADSLLPVPGGQSSNLEEAVLIELDSAVRGLGDMTLGAHAGSGISTQLGLFYDYRAEVTVTAVTSTTISGSFRLLDEGGNVVRAAQHFDAFKCPDKVLPVFEQ